MRGDEFLNKLDLVDPAFLEEAERKAPSAKWWSRGVRWAAAVAAVAALTVTAALSISPTLRGALQNALGGFVPYAQDMAEDEVSCTDQGIEVRVASALYDGNTITVFFEARDLIGDRLDEFTKTNTQIRWPTGQVEWRQGTHLAAVQIAYDKETKTALYRTSLIGDGTPAEGLTISLHGQGFAPGSHYDPHQPLPDEVISQTVLRTETLPDGSVVLVPLQNPTSVLDGSLTISSCGFGDDGQFHILLSVKAGTKVLPHPSVHTRAYLSGEETDGQPIGFSRDREASFDRDGMTYYDFTFQAAREDLDNMVIDQLVDLVQVKEEIEGEWHLEVPLENQLTTTISMERSGTAQAIGPSAAKLFLSPISCTVECEGGTGTLGYLLAVFHADGSVTSGVKCDSRYRGQDYTTTHWTFDQPIDPETVTAIAIGQWYVPIENGIAQPGHWLAETP